MKKGMSRQVRKYIIGNYEKPITMCNGNPVPSVLETGEYHRRENHILIKRGGMK